MKLEHIVLFVWEHRRLKDKYMHWEKCFKNDQNFEGTWAALNIYQKCWNPKQEAVLKTD
jgi:hypothetical protein